MKPVAYHRLAASELIKSAVFYERRQSTLGEAFLSAVEATLAKIRRNPELGKPGRLGTGSRKTKPFPFRIVYLEQPDR
jgi:plasmid stabilization system protein ParE